MKKLIIYIILLITGLKIEITLGQGSCNSALIGVSACCAELHIDVGPNCPFVDKIEIDLNGNLPFTGTVVSLNTIDPGTTGTLNSPANDFITFTNPTYFSSLGNVVVAEICFEHVNNGAVAPTITVSNAMPPSASPVCCTDIIEFIASCPSPEEWKKIYGDTEEEAVNRIKAFNDGVYVAGFKEVNGVDFASFAKFDITNGNLLWEKTLNIQSEFRDFDYNPSTNEFIVVGNTKIPPGQTQDNESIVSKWTPNGFMSGIKMYNHNGREVFQRVLIHKNPANPNFPVYIVGSKNPNGTPTSSFDLTMVYNMDMNLGVGWIREYPEISGVELEAHRGMEDLSDQNLLLLGNGSIANEGVVIKINGASGAWINTYYHPGNIDWYDALELPNGNIMLSGEDFGNNRALLMTIDPNSFTAITGIEFLDTERFEEVWFCATSNSIYTTAREISFPRNSIIYKTDFDLTTNIFNPIWAKYLDDGSLFYQTPHVFVSDQFNKLFFADARENSPTGFGDYDLLIASMDKEMTNCPCVQSFNTNNLGFTVSTTATTCTDPFEMEPIITQPFAQDTMGMCAAFCMLPPMCDFTFTTDCFDLDLTGTFAGGAAPFTFDWDIDGDNNFDLLNQNPASYSYFPFPATQTYNVTMRVTDASGVTCLMTKSITVQDITPPVISPCMDVTLNTDPGQCYATHGVPMVTDDCDDMPIISCTSTGATSGTNITQFDKGVSTVSCVATDASGNSNNCTYTVTVVDNEDPIITCPNDISMTVPGCDGGSIVSFPIPTFVDNCPMVNYTCTHNSGDFFPCGTTTVTCTATDMAGNTHTCSFDITINCECAELVSTSAVCNSTDEFSQDFTIVINSLAGLSSPNQFCTATATPAQGGIVLSNLSYNWIGQQLTVTGTATMACPTPAVLVIDVAMTCNCPSAPPLNCSLSAYINTQCCKTVSIDDTSICKNGPAVSIPLDCSRVCEVQQVQWYIADAPCPPTSWGTPFQVTNGCQPLLIDPQYHTANICIYAEVLAGPNEAPCEGTYLLSNTATITLCEPVTCSVSGGDEYCYDGTAITPNFLMGSLSNTNPLCNYTLQWYENGNVILGATNLNYQPPALSIPAGSCLLYTSPSPRDS